VSPEQQEVFLEKLNRLLQRLYLSLETWNQSPEARIRFPENRNRLPGLQEAFLKPTTPALTLHFLHPVGALSHPSPSFFW